MKKKKNTNMTAENNHLWIIRNIECEMNEYLYQFQLHRHYSILENFQVSNFFNVFKNANFDHSFPFRKKNLHPQY